VSIQRYPLVDLTPSASLDMTPLEHVDPQHIAAQLNDIGNAISETLDETESPTTLRLSKVEIALTIGAEGSIWFVARGSAEAAITLTLERPAAPTDAEHAPTAPDGAPDHS
jgi:hypothetical protein